MRTRDAARMARRGRLQSGLDRTIARTEQCEPPPDANQMVEHLEQDVHALLPRQPAYDDEQRPIAPFEPEHVLERALVALATRELACGIGLRKVCIGPGRPFAFVDPVEDSEHPVRACEDDTLQPHPELA